MSDSTQVVASVKTYADRDDFSDDLILEYIDVAQRRAQRILRIPPLEQTVVYTLTEDSTGDNTVISVPSDLISMIHLRTIEENGDTKLLYNSRADTRSYYGREGTAGARRNEYTRQGDQFILSPTVDKGDRVEIFYYRVLPAVNATYADNAANKGTVVTAGNTTTSAACTAASGTFNSGASTCSVDTYPNSIVGQEVAHWIRDQVPELLIYGALSELYSVVGDVPDDEKRFEQKFQDQISMMNSEEIRRRTTGGVTTTSFNTNGLI